MSLYDFTPPSDEELELLAGPEPAFPPFEEAEFEVNPVDRFLEGMARSGAQMRRPPRGFGEGLAAGFIGGLQGQGAQVATARERFNERQKARRLSYDDERREATRKYREKKFDVIREAFKAHKSEKTKEIEYERDNPMVTDQDVAKTPELAPLKGQRISRASYERAMMGPTPSEKRMDAAAERAEATQARAARMEDRRIELDNVKASNDRFDAILRLKTAYRMDDDVKGYSNIRSMLQQAEAAAKQQNGVGDHALIFAYMRGLEPTNPNAVREGEFATASKAVGAMQNVMLKATLRRFMRGDILLPEGREIILNVMRSGIEARRPDFDVANRQYVQTAKLMGIEDPEKFFLREKEAPAASGGRGAPADSLTRKRIHDDLERRRREGDR